MQWRTPVSTMVVSLPVQIADPLQRVAMTAVGTGIAKENHELLGRRTIATWVDYAPAAAVIAAFRWTSRQAHNRVLNLTISNVPGPRERGRIAGAVVSEIYSVGPVAAGSGLNITVWSYVDQLNISVLADDRTLRQPHEATDAMVHAFAETRRGTGLGQPSKVSTAMPQAHAFRFTPVATTTGKDQKAAQQRKLTRVEQQGKRVRRSEERPSESGSPVPHGGNHQ